MTHTERGIKRWTPNYLELILITLLLFLLPRVLQINRLNKEMSSLNNRIAQLSTLVRQSRKQGPVSQCNVILRVY